MAKTAILNVRVSTEFKQKLEEKARADFRSVTNYLEATLMRLWQEQERASSAAQKKGVPSRQR